MADLLPIVKNWLARQRADAARVEVVVQERRSRLGLVVRCLTEEYGVREVILFGSLVEGGTHAGSDVDLAVRGLAAARTFEALARVAEILDCNVDLVELETARPSLLQRIAETGEALARA
jgi:predicted nucleotidyltransferase